VCCTRDAQDLTCVLDQYVLKAASSADKRQAALARCRDSAQRPAHTPIGARRRNPQTRVPALQLGRGRYVIGGHPLPTGTRMAETVVEGRMRPVPWRVIADDTDQHSKTVPPGNPVCTTRPPDLTVHAARRRTSQTVAAMSSPESASSQLPSIH
jgi:hypothetical protein